MTSSYEDEIGTSIVPSSEFSFMVLLFVKVVVTVTLLSIAARIALVPWTTKCSPNRIIFAGADAIDFNILV